MRAMLLARIKSKWLFIACGALLVLLIAAVFTQYRWINRISEADRRQRHDLLNGMLLGFEQEFGQDLRVLIRDFRPAPGINPGADIERYLWMRWLDRDDTTRHSGLLDSIAIGIETKDGVVFKRLRHGEQLFSFASWPDELAAYRTILEQHLRLPGGDLPLFPRGNAFELEGGRPVIVFPLVETYGQVDEGRQMIAPPNMRGLLSLLKPSNNEQPERTAALKGWCFLELDQEFIQHTLFPALAKLHFGTSGLANYRFAVITGSPARVIYQSDPSLNTSEMSRTDGELVIFRRELLGPRPDFEPGRMPPRPLPPSPQPGSFEDAGRGGPPPFFGPGGRGRPGPRAGPPPDRPPDVDAWRLVANYSSGSLDAAVEQARLRNLALSFGVLLILAGSIAMLMVATRRAQRLAAQQMEFVAGVSHELRTPLAVIQSTSYNLAQGIIGEAGRVQQYGEVIQKETRRLVNQIERLLSFAGVQSGRHQYDMQPVRIAPIINHALGESAADFESGGWKVECDIEQDLPAVLADAPSIESAIQNLLQNALKYAAHGKYLGVSAKADLNGDRREIRIEVADRGPGIHPKDLPHIFEPFYRGTKAWDSPAPGTGLGLSLVQRHAEAHGGRVKVKSLLGQGTTFTLHLPAMVAGDAHAALDANDE